MSHSDVLDSGVVQPESNQPAHKRRAINAIWQPFLQFKLLMYMLGSTALVAVLLGAFLYFAFSDLVSVVTGKAEATSYYGEMIEIQLVHLFRYCGALFVLYILLLAAVCVAYTHRLIGPLRPFTRHVEALSQGDFSSRVVLRKGDLDIYEEYAIKLNELAVNLETRDKQGSQG
ncbi:MAG: hypothetical protein HKN42_09905 [Granulosicoccus sp.]|nr:hypothetical protein [Granulosicoccus sp.]